MTLNPSASRSRPSAFRIAGSSSTRQTVRSASEFMAGFSLSGKPLRLPRRRQHGAPPPTRRIQALRLGGEQLNRHVDEALVEETYDDPSLARHRSVHRVSCEKITDDRIL